MTTEFNPYNTDWIRASRESAKRRREEREDATDQSSDLGVTRSSFGFARSSEGTNCPANLSDPNKPTPDVQVEDRLRPGTYVNVSPDMYSVVSRPRPAKPPEPRLIRNGKRRSNNKTK